MEKNEEHRKMKNETKLSNQIAIHKRERKAVHAELADAFVMKILVLFEAYHARVAGPYIGMRDSVCLYI